MPKLAPGHHRATLVVIDPLTLLPTAIMGREFVTA